jgi:hypothetical protein
MSASPQSELGYLYSALLAVVGQNSTSVPLDPTQNNTRLIPCIRTINRATGNPNGSFNERKPATFLLYQSRSPDVRGLFVDQEIPPIYAKTPTDKVGAINIPGLNLFKSIDIKAGSTQLESVTPTSLLYSIRDSPLYRHAFDSLLNKMLGGFNSDYQRFHGVEQISQFDPSDHTKNVIKAAKKVTIPIVCSVFFRTEETFKFSLAIKSPLEFTFNANRLTNLFKYSEFTSIPDFSGEIEVFVECLARCEAPYMFNNAPSLANRPDEAYYAFQLYNDSVSKKVSIQGDLKINVKVGPCTNMKFDLNNTLMTSGDSTLFAGTDCSMAAKNILAGMVVPANPQVTNFAIDLSTGRFVINNTASYSNFTIQDWVAGGKEFSLVYAPSISKKYYTKIKCTVPFDSFGVLYFDPFTHVGNQTSNITAVPQVYYFSEFTLDIRPYDSTNTSFTNGTYSSLTFFTAVALNKGRFTFNPSLANVNQHAFWDVVEVVKSPLANDALYKFSLSTPIVTGNFFNPIANRSFVHINEQKFGWYDLDKSIPIKPYEIKLNRSVGGTEPIQEAQLAKYEMNYLPESRIRDETKPALDLWYSYGTFMDAFQSTFGFIDNLTEDIDVYELFLEVLELVFDGVVLSTIGKELANISKQSSNLELIVTQIMLRFVKYIDDTMLIMTEQDRRAVNQFALENVLIPDLTSDVFGLTNGGAASSSSSNNTGGMQLGSRSIGSAMVGYNMQPTAQQQMYMATPSRQRTARYAPY